MLYDKLNECIEKVNSEIQEFFPNKLTGKPPNIKGLNLTNVWIHFGLNGSDYDTIKGKPLKDSFMQSIEHLNDNTLEFKKIRKQLLDKGFIYEKYFSKPITFYASHSWFPAWQHPDFFRVFPQYQNEINNIIGGKEFISKHQKTLNDRFIIFSDLLFVRDKNSKNIKSSQVLNNFSDLIWESWGCQVDYYKPKGITIANAQAQDFIRNRLGAEKYSYLVYRKNIPIILSSQFSGGALSDPLLGMLRDLFGEVSKTIK